MEKEPEEYMCFRDDAFISVFGLSADNAIDYFSRCGAYDASCNNEHLKMQHQSRDALKHMIGLEYDLVRTAHEPFLFVIVKQRRLSPHSVEKLAYYYILDKCVYRAPTVHAVCVARVRTASEHLSLAFDRMRTARGWTLPKDYFWTHAPEDARTRREKGEEAVKRLRRAQAVEGAFAAMDRLSS